MTTPDPDLIIAIAKAANERTAYHEAGHAVATVSRGGRLDRVTLGFADWTTDDDSNDTPGTTEHTTTARDAPFVTFAGPWASAMWRMHVDGDDKEEGLDFPTALEYAWDDSADGDGAKYETVVARLSAHSEKLGLPLGLERPWEQWWLDELDALWPAVREVAATVLAHGGVTHEQVKAAIDSLPVEE